jgi:hypothetical protein
VSKGSTRRCQVPPIGVYPKGAKKYFDWNVLSLYSLNCARTRKVQFSLVDLPPFQIDFDQLSTPNQGTLVTHRPSVHTSYRLTSHSLLSGSGLESHVCILFSPQLRHQLHSGDRPNPFPRRNFDSKAESVNDTTTALSSSFGHH